MEIGLLSDDYLLSNRVLPCKSGVNRVQQNWLICSFLFLFLLFVIFRADCCFNSEGNICSELIVIRTTDRNMRIDCQSEHRITEHGPQCSVLSLKFMSDNTPAVSAHSTACCKYILNNKRFIAGKTRLVSGLHQFASYVPMGLSLYSAIW